MNPYITLNGQDIYLCYESRYEPSRSEVIEYMKNKQVIAHLPVDWLLTARVMDAVLDAFTENNNLKMSNQPYRNDFSKIIGMIPTGKFSYLCNDVIRILPSDAPPKSADLIEQQKKDNLLLLKETKLYCCSWLRQPLIALSDILRGDRDPRKPTETDETAKASIPADPRNITLEL